MMARRKNGKKKRPQEVSVERAVGEFLKTFAKEMPNFTALVMMDLLRTGLWNLKHYMETDPAFSWKSPFIQLEFDAPQMHPDRVAATEDLPDMKADLDFVLDHISQNLPKTLEISALQVLTRGVQVHRVHPFVDGDGRTRNAHIVMPAEVEAEVQALPEADRAAKVGELIAGFDLADLIKEHGGQFCDKAAGPTPFIFVLVCWIKPLVVDTIQGRVYYPIQVGIEFTQGDPTTWSAKTQKNFWTGLFKNLDAGIKELTKQTPGHPVPQTPAPDRAGPIPRDTFSVAQGFAPMHKLAQKDRAGMPLFRDENIEFHKLRTPLNWAVGLALFYYTSKENPDGWQEVQFNDLTDRVYCLTERGAPRRGDHRQDILAEVVKLHTMRNWYARFEWKQLDRVWDRNLTLGSDYAIPNLELVFVDKNGQRVRPSDPALRSLTVPLKVEGRRAYTPDGKDILAMPPDQYRLHSICWRWNPSFADDLKAAPVPDGRGRIKRRVDGKPLRGGFNIQIAVRIFDALTVLRAERAYVAHDLLILLAHDIYKPPKQSTAAGRNVVEREAEHLYDLLNLTLDPKHPERREETVAAAIFRLKQKDIGALLPGSDEYPRPPSEAEKTSGRRKSPFYRLVRSPAFSPAAILLTQEEAAALKADDTQASLPAAAAVPEQTPATKAKQKALPGLEAPPAPAVPSGTDIRAAREAAGMNLRTFAEGIGSGGSFNTWARYERGEKIRAGNIPADTWQRVRDFIAQNGPKAGS